jgi:hypothetical protein
MCPVTFVESNDAELSRPELPPPLFFLGLFSREGNMEYAGCSSTELQRPKG